MVNNQQLTYKNSICILTHIHKENLISYSNCEPLAAPVLEPAGRVDKRRLIVGTTPRCVGGATTAIAQVHDDRKLARDRDFGASHADAFCQP